MLDLVSKKRIGMEVLVDEIESFFAFRIQVKNLLSWVHESKLVLDQVHVVWRIRWLVYG